MDRMFKNYVSKNASKLHQHKHRQKKRTGLKIACIEEIAYNLKYIGDAQREEIIQNAGKSSYAEYLKKVLQ